MKTSPGFKTNNQQLPPHSARRDTDFQHHDFSHHDLNTSENDFHPQQQQQPQHQRDDTQDRGHGSSASMTGTVGKGNLVPSWFGSLRSFAISATTSSRGAFTPLNTSSSPSSSSSSSTSSSPKSSKKSRGRSSSIYYSSTRLYDDDDDDDNESGGSDSSRDDEPVTDLNGLKENRVRGPRVNWMALDPSLGSFFAGAGGVTYKPLVTSESNPDLASSNEIGCEVRREGGRVSGVEDLGIAEAPYYDELEDESGDEGRGGSGRSGSDRGRVRTSVRRASASGGDVSSCGEDSAWARAMDVSESGVVFTMPVAAPSSTLAFLKSYVPTLGGGSDPTTSPTTASPTKTSTVSPTSPTSAPAAAAAGGGFWSLRKLSMNFLSGNQYSAVGNNDKSALTGEDEDDDGVEEGESRPREQGRRAGFRDDYDDFDDYGDGLRRKMDDAVGINEMTPMTPPASVGAGGGLTVSYLASMVSNATHAGVQYIPVQVREQLPVAVTSTRSSLKKD